MNKQNIHLRLLISHIVDVKDRLSIRKIGSRVVVLDCRANISGLGFFKIIEMPSAGPPQHGDRHLCYEKSNDTFDTIHGYITSTSSMYTTNWISR